MFLLQIFPQTPRKGREETAKAIIVTTTDRDVGFDVSLKRMTAQSCGHFIKGIELQNV
jgi:hypothetical protein